MRSDIADHLFIPQSHTSNMCVCGEPNTAHVSVPTPVAPSFHMETSIGGIPVTLCACGLLMYQPMATVHIAKCESYRKTLRTETFTAPTLEYAAPVECDCQCARCGSSCGWIDCSDCLHGVITTEDDEGFDVVEHCSTCGGCGGWWCCLSSAEWCAANPVPGREHVARGSVEWFDVPADTSTSERRPDPIRACPCCGDDAELVGAPGPNEPTDEYVCSSCDCNFTSDGTITFVSDECASRAATSTNRDDDGR